MKLGETKLCEGKPACVDEGWFKVNQSISVLYRSALVSFLQIPSINNIISYLSLAYFI